MSKRSSTHPPPAIPPATPLIAPHRPPVIAPPEKNKSTKSKPTTATTTSSAIVAKSRPANMGALLTLSHQPLPVGRTEPTLSSYCRHGSYRPHHPSYQEHPHPSCHCASH